MTKAERVKQIVSDKARIGEFTEKIKSNDGAKDLAEALQPIAMVFVAMGLTLGKDPISVATGACLAGFYLGEEYAKQHALEEMLEETK